MYPACLRGRDDRSVLRGSENHKNAAPRDLNVGGRGRPSCGPAISLYPRHESY